MGARAGKYKYGAKASKYKLGIGVGGRSQVPGAKQRAGGRKIQTSILEPEEYKLEYEKILKREDISFQVIALVERYLKQSTIENNFILSPLTIHTLPHSDKEISCKLP